MLSGLKSVYTGPTKKAVCVIRSDKIKATIHFIQENDITTIFGQVFGLTPNMKHGFHIHECGDLTDDCNSCCAHYNPYNSIHGGPESAERHVGDLGNLLADNNGNCNFIMKDHLVKLSGPYNVIGRSVVIHMDEDDLGKGFFSDSKTTGHSGKRIGCGVIGIAST